MNVVGLGYHVRQLLLVYFFITLLFDLLDGLLDHALPFLLEREVELHVENAKQRGVELLVLEHVPVEGALGAVKLVLQLSLPNDVELIEWLVVDRRQEGVQELRATLPDLLKYIFDVRFHGLQRGIDASNQLLAFLLLLRASQGILLWPAGSPLSPVRAFLLALKLLELVQLLLYLRLLQRYLLRYFFLLLRFFVREHDFLALRGRRFICRF